MKGKTKGQWKYIESQRIKVLIITVILYLCAAGLYLIGYLTLNTRRNLWTVFAVLSILPASKSLVNLIMFMRFRSLSSNVHNEYEAAAGELSLIYELPFTTYEKTYFVDAIACAGNTVAGVYLGKPSSGSSREQDIKKLTSHLETVLSNDGHKDFTVKIYENKDDFIKRVREMNDKLKDRTTRSDIEILNTLKAVSL